MVRTRQSAVLLVLITSGLAASAELGAAEVMPAPDSWSAMSQYGALAAPACGAPNGYAGFQACCPKTPHCCDNAWACYCEWKARWHALWSRVGEPPCGQCGLHAVKGGCHLADSPYLPAGAMVLGPDVLAPTQPPAAAEQLNAMPQPTPIRQPTPATQPGPPGPLPNPPLPGPGFSEPIEPAPPGEPAPPQAQPQPPQAPLSPEVPQPPKSPSSSSAAAGTGATPASAGSLWRQLFPWSH